MTYSGRLSKFYYRRDWSKYSKGLLLSEIEKYNMDMEIEDIQSDWNKLKINIFVRMLQGWLKDWLTIQ